MTEEFSFRPAPLRQAVEWRLDGDALEGPDGSFDLSRIERATFVETPIRGMRMRRLDLGGTEGVCRIAINSTRGLPPEDPDRAAHQDLCRAVAARLADRAPDLPVTIGERGAIRAIWFGLGVVSLLAGLGLGVGALASGLSGDRLIGAAVPLVLLTLLGGLLMSGCNPWRKPPQIPVEALPALLDTLEAPPESGEAE